MNRYKPGVKCMRLDTKGDWVRWKDVQRIVKLIIKLHNKGIKRLNMRLHEEGLIDD